MDPLNIQKVVKLCYGKGYAMKWLEFWINLGELVLGGYFNIYDNMSRDASQSKMNHVVNQKVFSQQ